MNNEVKNEWGFKFKFNKQCRGFTFQKKGVKK